jgi:hypothetical protein
VRFEERAANHRHNHHSFLYLAQRSREIDSPGIDEKRGQAIIDDLERDFQILKVRGQEPTDRNFRVGQTFLKGIGESQFARLQTSHLQSIPDGPALDEAVTETPSREDKLLERVRRNSTSVFERHARGVVWIVSSLAFVALVGLTVVGVVKLYGIDMAKHRSPGSHTVMMDTQTLDRALPRQAEPA